MDTKTCSITENEIKWLISKHGGLMTLEAADEHIERINYLNKRLKADKKEPKPEPPPITEQKATASW
jgi:hypothetical protein